MVSEAISERRSGSSRNERPTSVANAQAMPQGVTVVLDAAPGNVLRARPAAVQGRMRELGRRAIEAIRPCIARRILKMTDDGHCCCASGATVQVAMDFEVRTHAAPGYDTLRGTADRPFDGAARDDERIGVRVKRDADLPFHVRPVIECKAR